MQTTHLGNKPTHILERIFQHPASHNLEWRDVIALIEHLGTVEEQGNGHLVFTVHGVSQSFHRAHAKDVSEVQEVLDIRRFLESAGIDKDGVIATTGIDAAPKLRMLVVINQQETRSIPRRFGQGDPAPTEYRPPIPGGIR